MALIHLITNNVSGSSTTWRYTNIETSLDEGNGNGLGVGWSANMGDFNPFLWNVLEVHHGVSAITQIRSSHHSSIASMAACY